MPFHYGFHIGKQAIRYTVNEAWEAYFTDEQILNQMIIFLWCSPLTSIKYWLCKRFIRQTEWSKCIKTTWNALVWRESKSRWLFTFCLRTLVCLFAKIGSLSFSVCFRYLVRVLSESLTNRIYFSCYTVCSLSGWFRLRCSAIEMYMEPDDQLIR